MSKTLKQKVDTAIKLLKTAEQQAATKEAKMVEVWRDIACFEGKYQVSNFGRVKSLQTSRKNNCSDKKENYIILSNILQKTGYYRVHLRKMGHGHGKCVFVHRLVAEAFIPNPNNYPQINHKDEVKTNNYVDNLEWCTEKYNSNYNGVVNRRRNTFVKNHGRAVDAYDLNGVLLASYDSISDISKSGFSTSNIICCCKGGIITSKGYVWRFKDEPFDKYPTDGKKRLPKKNIPLP